MTPAQGTTWPRDDFRLLYRFATDFLSKGACKLYTEGMTRHTLKAVALHQPCAPAMQQPMLTLGLVTTTSYSDIAGSSCARAHAVANSNKNRAVLTCKDGLAAL